MHCLTKSKRQRTVGLGALFLPSMALSLQASTPFASSCPSSLGAQYCEHFMSGMKESISTGVVTLTWLGTAGIIVRDANTAILIDPFVSRPGLGRVVLGRPLRVDSAKVDHWLHKTGVSHADAVLVSHSHYDHAMDAPTFALKTGASLFGSRSTINIGLGQGLKADHLVEVKSRESYAAGAFKITFLESAHGKIFLGQVPFEGTIDAPLPANATARAYRLGGVYSILLEHPQGTLLHHASAATRPETLTGIKAHTVVLGLSGRPQTESYLQAVVDTVGAKRVLPIHFDNFFKSLDLPLEQMWGVGLDEFLTSASRHLPELTLGTLPLGEPVVLFP